jgi:pimeloyl-ACP methyl ester carboxylesterase
VSVTDHRKIVFLHGSGGSKESWHYQLRAFPDARALDLPGHPDGEPCRSIEACVAWLRAELGESSRDDLVLVGHSLGGAIALQYALDRPDEIAAIILVGSGARLRVHPQYLRQLERAIESGTEIGDALDVGYELVDAELAEVLKRRRAENGPAVTLTDLRACDRFDLMDRVGEIRTPTLALCGSDDIMTPPKYSLYLAEHMPDARAVVLPGGTHMVFAENPGDVNRAIAEFLRDVGLGSTSNGRT